MTKPITAAVAAGVSLLAMSTAYAQAPRAITPGQTVQGQLTNSDLKAEDDSFYDEYTLQLQAGQGVTVTMNSDAFDAFLQIGQGRGTNFNATATDDDGAGNGSTNARLRFRASEAGSYVIRANSLAGGQTGAYTVAVEQRAAGAAPKTATLQLSPSGVSTTGVLADGGARVEDDQDQLYAYYTVTLRKGDIARFDLKSEFDNRVRLGKINNGAFEELASDDDSGGDGDARLIYRAEEAGTYTLRAEAFDSASAGDYALTGTLLPPPPAREPRPVGIRRGETKTGALAVGDAITGSYTLYDTYELRGRAGETFKISLSATDDAFDPVLEVGGFIAGEWAMLTQNDDRTDGESDGAGSLNSQLEFTFKDGGTVLLRARSISDGATGGYTLQVE